jgi:ABC-2 type transport system permease protein
MKTILYIIQKEFIQVFRNRTMLPIIFVVPIFQLLILVNAATFEMKNIRFAFLDNDLSATSRKLVNNFNASPFFINKGQLSNFKQADDYLRKGEVDMVIIIDDNFDKNLTRSNKADVQFLFDAINGTKAGISNAYATSIINTFSQNLRIERLGLMVGNSGTKQISVVPQYWYNPQLNYKNFMVPAVLVILVTMIGLFLSALNLVREKEIGTIEQINVTPIKKYQFIAGKLIPFWILALLELAFGLFIGKLLFDIPIVGNISDVFVFAAIYLLIILGMGLLISTITQTQQQTMFIGFFVFMIFILMSGVFTAVESMPHWAQQLDHINPLYYFVRAIRMILLKGSGLTDLLPEMAAMSVLAILMISLAVWRYRKVS